ncbi:hypothetical protein [Planococcus shixiaomingii]|uniref:hypothetical protein n=1 Tax=Planococcus shixiaomingii TaxID=3058393 RepID=UPI0026112AA9|nr:hypothetical protein [Planococcus sp. N022]WKA55474.1 hypothetical protein QWY21_03575 [Planococcus sp. N022]
MEIGFYLMLAVLGSAFICLVGYDMKKKAQMKLANIQLERDRIALEQMKMELEHEKKRANT